MKKERYGVNKREDNINNCVWYKDIQTIRGRKEMVDELVDIWGMEKTITELDKLYRNYVLKYTDPNRDYDYKDIEMIKDVYYLHTYTSKHLEMSFNMTLHLFLNSLNMVCDPTNMSICSDE